MSAGSDEVACLLRDVEWALAHELGPRDLVPMLEKLVRHAPKSSAASHFGRQCLSEIIVEADPWRAAVLARGILEQGEDDRAWAVLGLSHTLMGNYRSAARAYTHAIALSPGCASYHHNLGHMLDVALDRPRAALAHLQTAYRAEPDEEEIAASYAHALLRCDQREEAHRILKRALGRPKAERLLEGWVARQARLEAEAEARAAAEQAAEADAV